MELKVYACLTSYRKGRIDCPNHHYLPIHMFEMLPAPTTSPSYISADVNSSWFLTSALNQMKSFTKETYSQNPNKKR
eukprot:5486574-Amphidinium_carterae.1